MTKAEKLAEAHVSWEQTAIARMVNAYENYLDKRHDLEWDLRDKFHNLESELRCKLVSEMFKLVKDNFIHGYKHGEEDGE